MVHAGGRLIPLILPSEISGGTGVMNPSIGYDPDGDLLVNIRSVNYAFYNCESKQKFPSIWGPLSYFHPENDIALRTQNYLGRLDSNLNLKEIAWVDTSEFDKPPLWTFSGHEDVRVITWGKKLFLTGVRRDTEETGQGRMELSEISINKKTWTVKEVSRRRIPAPGANDTYCEKNWVPILSREFQYLKWSSPTEVVEVSDSDPVTVRQVSLEKGALPTRDLRGSTHMVPWRGYFVAITHEVDLQPNYLKQKNGKYFHRLCVWNAEMSLIGFSEAFSFLGAQVEFACGGVPFENDLLVSFGFSDSSAFLLQIPGEFMDDLVERIISETAR